MSGISNYLRGFFKSKSEDGSTEAAEPKNTIQPQNDRLYGRDFYPLRKIFLWGTDYHGNPCFLVLYGYHEFNGERDGKHILKDEVRFTEYTIFRGKMNHFPSFEAVKAEFDHSYYSPYRREPKRDLNRKMYYKKDSHYNYYEHQHHDPKPIKDFTILKDNEIVTFPYCDTATYEDYLHVVKAKHLKFHDFTLADSPQDVLHMDQNYVKHYEAVCHLFTNPNIYLRKKILKELVLSEPSYYFYQYLLKIGSCELISGLFLELAKQKKDILISDAKYLLGATLTWESESYIKGLKRCLNLYMNSFDQEIIAQKTKEIKDTLPLLDLHLISINGRALPQDQILEGSAYMKYASQGELAEYGYEWSYKLRKYTKLRRKNLYPVSKYSDGVILHMMEMKNTIQESELFGLYDVLGKIAYYLDAPRLTYYLKGNSKSSALRYYRGYIRRILDELSIQQPKQFMLAMKELLTSYQPEDYLAKKRDNFQFNYFIKHYLYYDFNEKAPESPDWSAISAANNKNYSATNREYNFQWSIYREWFSQDQLLKLEGRHEFHKDIWDTFIEDVMEIAAEVKVPTIAKALYYIMKDNAKIEQADISLIIKLADVNYEPTSRLFADMLMNRLRQQDEFDASLMSCLMKCRQSVLHETAIQYFKDKNGHFPAKEIVSLFLSDSIDIWHELIRTNIMNFHQEDLVYFIEQCLSYFQKQKEDVKERMDLRFDILEASIIKVKEVSADLQSHIWKLVIECISQNADLSDYILDYCEKLLLSVSFEQMRLCLNAVGSIPQLPNPSERAYLLTSLLQSVKDLSIPSDSLITKIQITGTPQAVYVLQLILLECKSQLESRFSTLLLLFESDVVSFREISKQVFEEMPADKQMKFHAIILDSPDEKAYSYALKMLDDLYEKTGTGIPQEFLIQLLEHGSPLVKSYVSNKMEQIIKDLGNSSQTLFLYYVKTLLLLPSKLSTKKDSIYQILPEFAQLHQDYSSDVEDLLLHIGSSNSKLDSERALVTLVRIKKEALN